MKNKNAFFAIGTIGMIITAVLHVVMATLIQSPSVHTGFIVLYPTFMTFIALGMARMLKAQPVRVRRK